MALDVKHPKPLHVRTLRPPKNSRQGLAEVFSNTDLSARRNTMAPAPQQERKRQERLFWAADYLMPSEKVACIVTRVQISTLVFGVMRIGASSPSAREQVGMTGRLLQFTKLHGHTHTHTYACVHAHMHAYMHAGTKASNPKPIETLSLHPSSSLTQHEQLSEAFCVNQRRRNKPGLPLLVPRSHVTVLSSILKHCTAG